MCVATMVATRAADQSLQGALDDGSWFRMGWFVCYNMGWLAEGRLWGVLHTNSTSGQSVRASIPCSWLVNTGDLQCPTY